MPIIRRAIISVSDKTGIVEFARVLHERGAVLLSTGGTAAALRAAGLPVVEVAEYTGFPELLDGRVKTLHPTIHGGILARRENAAHMTALQEQGIAPIDCVVANLYPFEATIAKTGATFAEAIEHIDIGGPALLRAAAKNHADVVAVCDPADYAMLARELTDTGTVSPDTSRRLAQKVFSHTAGYDAAIAHYLLTNPISCHCESRRGEAISHNVPTAFPDRIVTAYAKLADLRYGENPHQSAAWYRCASAPPWIGEPLQGKELSYNNLLDIDAAIGCVREFDGPAVVIVKHGNPCGVGAADRAIEEAFGRALAGDPTAAFGGIVGCNRSVDASTASAIARTFFEVVCAPAFSEEARTIFAAKKNLRLIPYDPNRGEAFVTRGACGGQLVQSTDAVVEGAATWKVATKRPPTPVEVSALTFAWRVAKHVRSNAIVVSDAAQTLGIGAGQMSRLDAANVAVMKMQELVSRSTQDAARRTGVCVAASDAFFPFRDGVDALARVGVTAIVQPGGSIRDAEVIAAADEHGIAMVFTGVRHFKH